MAQLTTRRGATSARGGATVATVTLPLNSPVTTPKREGALARTGTALKSVKEEIRRGLQGKRTEPTPERIARLRDMGFTTAYDVSRQLRIELHEAEQALKAATQ